MEERGSNARSVLKTELPEKLTPSGASPLALNVMIASQSPNSVVSAALSSTSLNV